MNEAPVLVAGGGPVGVITALALAQRGIPVRVFEAAESVNDAPRASTLHPATLEMLAAIGLLDEVTARGLVAPTFQFWDRPTRSVVAQFDHAILKNDTPYPFVVQCEQHKIANLAIEKLRAFKHAEVNFSSPVTAITTAGDHVEITVTANGTDQTVLGSYLVGADGGRSTVRKSLDIPFDGYTFPERFLVLTTLFDFATEHGVAYRAYFSDPDEWTNLFKVAGDDGKGRWRAVFPAQPGQTDEEVLNEAATEARLQKFFPKSGIYDIVHRNIYRGGLGLNCGIHDATHLSVLLSSVLSGERPESDLETYDSVRRPMNIEYVQQQTIANKKRLEEKEPATREANFDDLRRTAADPVAHRAFLMRTSLLESVRKQKAAA